MIHRVNCRPASQKHTPKAPGLRGLRPLLSLLFSSLSRISCYICASSFFFFVLFCAKSAVVRLWSLPAHESLRLGC